MLYFSMFFWRVSILVREKRIFVPVYKNEWQINKLTWTWEYKTVTYKTFMAENNQTIDSIVCAVICIDCTNTTKHHLQLFSCAYATIATFVNMKLFVNMKWFVTMKAFVNINGVEAAGSAWGPQVCCDLSPAGRSIGPETARLTWRLEAELPLLTALRTNQRGA